MWPFDLTSHVCDWYNKSHEVTDMNNELNINLIFDYIKNNNLNKTQFCRQSKISTSTFNRIINGKDFQLIA